MSRNAGALPGTNVLLDRVASSLAPQVTIVFPSGASAAPGASQEERLPDNISASSSLSASSRPIHGEGKNNRLLSVGPVESRQPLRDVYYEATSCKDRKSV